MGDQKIIAMNTDGGDMRDYWKRPGTKKREIDDAVPFASLSKKDNVRTCYPNEFLARTDDLW